ncbi:MAG TPA: hypothetical protein VMV19_02350 [Xanthobacteraceae bacterium]|nr:hypothetical protein [Xanthobacteraceae bacterium]
MATLVELVRQGLVLKWDVDLEPRQQIERCLFLLPHLAPRFLHELPAVGSTWNIEETPEQQLDALTEAYVSGRPLIIDRQVKHLVRHKSAAGVWYLKTADVRLFGWFALRDYFIAASFGFVEQIKATPGIYHGFGNEVVRYRDQLPLDEPKFVPGDDPHAVISNVDYPA